MIGEYPHTTASDGSSLDTARAEITLLRNANSAKGAEIERLRAELYEVEQALNLIPIDWQNQIDRLKDALKPFKSWACQYVAPTTRPPFEGVAKATCGECETCRARKALAETT